MTPPDNVSANALSEFILRGNFSGHIFYTLQSIIATKYLIWYNRVYGIEQDIQCIPCINKNNPSQGKTFYKMESLELSTRFVTDSEHKQSINQTLSLASRDYFYAKNYLSYSPIKNRTLQIINPFYLSTLTTLHDIPQNPYLTNILF